MVWQFAVFVRPHPRETRVKLRCVVGGQRGRSVRNARRAATTFA